MNFLHLCLRVFIFSSGYKIPGPCFFFLVVLNSSLHSSCFHALWCLVHNSYPVPLLVSHFSHPTGLFKIFSSVSWNFAMLCWSIDYISILPTWYYISYHEILFSFISWKNYCWVWVVYTYLENTQHKKGLVEWLEVLKSITAKKKN
jgi:hypothetical protein